MILQACPACDRQFDVAHLSAGDRVRCPCGEHFRVRAERELRVRGLACDRCGGAIGPGDEACPYCGAAIPEAERDSLLCPRCFARMPGGSKHCPGCGVEIRPQALSALPERSACPRCEGELAVRSLGEVSVIECSACRGLWLTRQEFERLLRRAREEADVLPDPRTAEEPVSAAEPERRVTYIPCPTCGQRMNRRMFRYRELPSRVVIDLCREHGVWFDAEELARILAFVRERANLDLPPSPASLERRPQPLPVPPSRSLSGGDVVEALWIAEMLGDVVGEVLGGLFD